MLVGLLLTGLSAKTLDSLGLCARTVVLLVLLAERGFDVSDLLEVGLAELGFGPSTSKVLRSLGPAAFKVLSLDTGLGVRDGAKEVRRGLSWLRLVAESVEVVECLLSRAEVDLSSLVDEADLQMKRNLVSRFQTTLCNKVNAPCQTPPRATRRPGRARRRS